MHLRKRELGTGRLASSHGLHTSLTFGGGGLLGLPGGVRIAFSMAAAGCEVTHDADTAASPDRTA